MLFFTEKYHLFPEFINYHSNKYKRTVMPCTGMQCIKTQVLEIRCTLFSHIFIRIQVGYTEQYIDLLKSYLNLNKYMTKKTCFMVHLFPGNWVLMNIEF